MGSWGYGVFDSDGALDFIGDIVDKYCEAIDESFKTIEDESSFNSENEDILVLVRLLDVICNESGAAFPDVKLVECWKEKYTPLFEKYAPANWLHTEDMVNRRKVIQDTFNSLIKDTKEFWKEAD